MEQGDRARLTATVAGGDRPPAPAPSRPRVSRAEGRRFALTLAAGFAVLAAAATWRERTVLAATLALAAAFLIAAALLVPHRLGPLHRAWTALGQLISRITTPIVYSAIYLLVLTPMGIARRTFGRSPLARDPRTPSYWVDRPAVSADALRRQLERKF